MPFQRLVAPEKKRKKKSPHSDFRCRIAIGNAAVPECGPPSTCTLATAPATSNSRATDVTPSAFFFASTSGGTCRRWRGTGFCAAGIAKGLVGDRSEIVSSAARRSPAVLAVSRGLVKKNLGAQADVRGAQQRRQALEWARLGSPMHVGTAADEQLGQADVAAQDRDL